MNEEKLSEYGLLEIEVFGVSDVDPIEGATVTITGPNTNEKLTTNDLGKTRGVSLPTPPIVNSLEEEGPKPYSEYTITVNKDGYREAIVNNVQIFPNTTGIQRVFLEPDTKDKEPEVIDTKDPVLWGSYPAKEPEAEVKPLDNFKGLVVLPEVVIPEFIIVHDGIPTDTTAKNYTVPFKDYIKNVASSEIYSNWPLETIKANVLAIISFTLNRVYTEWYPSMGYNFTITSSTAYDQAYDHGRVIYQEISDVVDQLFNQYVTKKDIKQPLFTQYCDGEKSTCPKWLSQWGSKNMGENGSSALNILKKYYGNDIYLDTAPKVEGVPKSFGGNNLSTGSSGSDVRIIQEQLNAIAKNYPLIGKIKVDGDYGEGTKKAVEVFQEIFDLPVTGVVNSATWYTISQKYVAVTKMVT